MDVRRKWYFDVSETWWIYHALPTIYRDFSKFRCAMMRKGRVCQVQSSCSQHRGGSRNCYAVDLEFVDHTGLEAKLFTYAADDISGCFWSSQGAGKHLLELRGVGGSGPKKKTKSPAGRWSRFAFDHRSFRSWRRTVPRVNVWVVSIQALLDLARELLPATFWRIIARPVALAGVPNQQSIGHHKPIIMNIPFLIGSFQSTNSSSRLPVLDWKFVETHGEELQYGTKKTCHVQ